MTESERIAELTVRAQRGGDDAAEAFEELYAAYGKRVYYFCRCLLGDEEAAIDATRSVFLYAWRNLRSMPAGQTFYLWVCGNAFYFVKIALAGLRGAGVTVEEVDGDPSLFDSMAHQPEHTAAEINVRRNHLEAVTDLLSALPDGDRICVLLYDYARFPVEEVAGMVGCSADTVKCRVYNGHTALAQGLEERTPGDGELFRPYLDKLIRTCGKNCTLPEVVTERIREGLQDGDAVEFPDPHPDRAIAEDDEPRKSTLSPVLMNRICIVLGILFAGALLYILYWFLSSPKTPAEDLSSAASSQVIDTSSQESDPVSEALSESSEAVSQAASSGEVSEETSSEESTVSGDESVPPETSEETSSSAESSVQTSSPAEESSQLPVLGELPRATENLRLRSEPSTADPNNLVITIPKGAHIDILETVTDEAGALWYKARYTVRPGLWYEGYCSAAYVQTEETE